MPSNKFLPMILSLFCMANTTYAQDNIDKLIANDLPNTDIGIIVTDAETGKTLYEHNSFRAFTPASNTKLFSSAAALFYLKPNYQYKTLIKVNPTQLKNKTLQGDLHIVFSGDPSLTIKNVNHLLAEVRRYGIKRINGNIILDGSRFEEPYYPAGTSFEDMNWYYAAPVSAFIINENTIPLTITANETLGKPIQIKIDKKYNFIKVHRNVTTVTENYVKNHCAFKVKVNQKNDIDLSGCWPISKHASTERVAVKNPFYFAKMIIRRHLLGNKLKLHGRILPGTTPTQLKTIAEHQSKPLKDIVKHILKDSDNLYANSVLKTMGYQYYNHGNFKEGVNVINHILRKKTAIDVEQIHLSDGEGTRFNLVTPHQISQLLYAIYHAPSIKDEFISALAIAGKDGTLADRMTSKEIRGKIFAKTGTMHDTSALSGYVTTNNNKKLIFAILINHMIDDIKIAKHLEDKICNVLVKFNADQEVKHAT